MKICSGTSSIKLQKIRQITQWGFGRLDNDNPISALRKALHDVDGYNTALFLLALKSPVPKTPKKGMRIPPMTLSEVAAICSN